MTMEEMSKATDNHLLNLFNELSDKTLWESPRLKWSNDFSRAGGSIQQSREFNELIKKDPDRFFRILPHLKPQEHEIYVASALQSLAEVEDISHHQLFQLIISLDQQGFVSEDFRSTVVSALEKLADNDCGLPVSMVSLLESWILTHTKPELSHYQSEVEKIDDLKYPIVFGMGSSHSLPSGRGSIVRAIASGYLKQNPADLKGWSKFINSRLGVEKHPAVWADILSRMPKLLNGNRIDATKLFDAVIQNCPKVLSYKWSIFIISRTIGWFEPKETVQSWLKMLLFKQYLCQI